MNFRTFLLEVVKSVDTGSGLLGDTLQIFGQFGEFIRLVLQHLFNQAEQKLSIL